MQRLIHVPATMLGIAMLGSATPAAGHAEIGDREFPATLTIDDPAVTNEASIPSFVYSVDGTGSEGTEKDIDFELDKTITDRLGIGIDDGYAIFDPAIGKAHRGWEDISTTLKYQAIAEPEPEFMASVGIVREWGGTGAAQIGADRHGTTTPTVYFGKGFGDLPIGDLRALAITGTFGFQVPDEPRVDPAKLAIGLSVQYSMEYLGAMGVELPDFVTRLTPLVEFNLTTPTSGSSLVSTKATIAPGLIYSNELYQLGIEALIPATEATGRGVGMIAQVHFYFD